MNPHTTRCVAIRSALKGQGPLSLGQRPRYQPTASPLSPTNGGNLDGHRHSPILPCEAARAGRSQPEWALCLEEAILPSGKARGNGIIGREIFGALRQWHLKDAKQPAGGL
ncbi:MAG: hypothetical protein ACI4A8_07155 [Muribaculaceae bacterium]